MAEILILIPGMDTQVLDALVKGQEALIQSNIALQETMSANFKTLSSDFVEVVREVTGNISRPGVGQPASENQSARNNHPRYVI